MRLPFGVELRFRQRQRIDTAQIARESAERASEQLLSRVASEMSRALIERSSAAVKGSGASPGNAPMPLPPNPAAGSLFPLYAWDNPLWYSTPQAPTRRPGSYVDTRTLRQLADNYDILRDCIQHLKREVASVPLNVVAKDAKDVSRATRAQIAEANEFLTSRGGLGGPGCIRSKFEGMAFEDLMVIGYFPVYYHPNRGGGVYEAAVIDAATIRPRVDAWGWPGPGENVYEQWVLGIQVRGFTREEMEVYGLSINSRSYTPWYASPIEWLIQVVTAALSTDAWNREWLTHGTTPSDMLAMPQDWTLSQIKDYMQIFTAMMEGNTRLRQQMKVVPGGSQRVQSNSRKDQDFQEFERWLMQRTCAIMGVHPAAIGFSGDQYAVTQENSMDQTSAFGAAVLLETRATFYVDLFMRCGWDRIEARNVVATEEAADVRAKRTTSLVAGGVYTPNEARAEEGKDPIEGGDALMVPATLRPLEQALAGPAPQPGGAPATQDDQGAQRVADLRRWEQKALRHLKAEGSPACSFVSDFLPASVVAMLNETLPGAAHPVTVRTLFHLARREMQEIPT